MQEENTSQKNTEKIIRTYSSDLARALKEKEMTTIKIAVAEKEKKGEPIYVENKNNKKINSKILFFIGGLFLIGVSIFVYYYLNEKRKDLENVEIVSLDPQTKISYESKTYFTVLPEMTISDIYKFIEDEKEKGENKNVKSIFLKKIINSETQEEENLTTLEFLSLLKTTAPSALIRSLSDNFMIGLYKSTSQINTGNEKPNLFLIFETKDYNQTYASMLSWERTLLDDMVKIFNLNITDKNVFENKWRDIIINNKDVRVVNNSLGEGVLYYFFLDKTSFVVTDNIETIKEIIKRFQIK